MNDYNKITALYSRLSVGDEDRGRRRKQLHTEPEEVFGKLRQTAKIDEYRHYIDDDESGRFFDRSAYSRNDRGRRKTVKSAVCIMKDMTRWGARLSPSRQRYGAYSDGTMCALSRSTTG